MAMRPTADPPTEPSTSGSGLAARFVRSPQWFKVGLGIGMVVVVALGLGGQRVYESFLDNPRFCLSCHEPNPSMLLFADDSHRDMPCQRCHYVDDDAIRSMLYATVFRDSSRPHRASKPLDRKCTGCHFDPTATSTTVLASPGHAQHAPKAKCLTCHGSRFHAVRRPEEQCASCHPELASTDRMMSQVHCKSCHNFVDAEATVYPNRRDCRSCHEREHVAMPEFGRAGHMATEPCFTCHEAHGRPPLATCEGCHLRASSSPLHVKHDDDSCTECHAAHTFIVRAETCVRHHHHPPMAAKLQLSEWRAAAARGRRR